MSIALRHWWQRFLQHPAEVFVFLALASGLLLTFRMPPLIGSDEFAHFSRAYQVSEGHLWASRLPDNTYGGELPSGLGHMIDEYRDLMRKNDQEYPVRAQELQAIYTRQRSLGDGRETLSFSNSAVYSPWSYIPSVIGIRVARLLNLPLAWYVYLARICTLLVYVALAWLAIRWLVSGKWFLVALALVPTALVQAVTVSPDVLVNGLSWLIIAATISLLAKRLPPKPWLLVTLVAAGLLLSTTKQGYVLIALLPIVAIGRFTSTRKQTMAIGAFWIVLLVIATALFMHTTGAIATQALPAVREGVYTSIPHQEQVVLAHPVRTGWQILSQPFTKSYDTVFLGLVGIITNRLIYLSVLVVGLIYAGLFLAWSETTEVRELSRQRYKLFVIAGSVIIGTFLLVSLALYLSFTQVGHEVVEGLQGRYFLPVLPLFLVFPLTSGQRVVKLNQSRAIVVILALICVGLLSTWLALA